MHTIRKLGLLTAIRSLQTAEFMLDGLLHTRPFLPFAACSLLCGFAIGFVMTRF
ncbi:MAG: hypothetical protein JW748_10110 [Anaerolineales bacterium]|nr:hypothetical protein [Anaerolineales bacterium]